MTIEAVAEAHLGIIWLVLIAASAGVFLHAGIKFPYFVFFARDSGIRVRDPPINQIVGMGIASFLCIFLGMYPMPLYSILPYHVDFNPYTLSHVVETLSLLSFSGLAFFICLPLLRRTETISLDTDWIFRIAGRKFIWFCEQPLITFAEIVDGVLKRIASFFAWLFSNPAVASKMFIAMTGAIVFKPFNPLNEKYERDLEMLRNAYPKEMAHRHRHRRPARAHVLHAVYVHLSVIRRPVALSPFLVFSLSLSSILSPSEEIFPVRMALLHFRMRDSARRQCENTLYAASNCRARKLKSQMGLQREGKLSRR